jgi:hypothetical protein
VTRSPAGPGSSHRLGFAVKVLAGGGLPSHDTRRWQSGPHLRTSLAALRRILDHLDRHDLRMYRMATSLAPYASNPDLPQFHHQVAECAEELAAVGSVARARDIRLSTHPGQYTVLSSERDGVRAAAAAELEIQASLLDAMGLGADAVVVLHVGSAAAAVMRRSTASAGPSIVSRSERGRDWSSRTTTAPSTSPTSWSWRSGSTCGSSSMSCTTTATTGKASTTPTPSQPRWTRGQWA